MEETYVDIMLQSLEKKEQILDLIIRANKKQKRILESKESTPDEFDKTVEQKSQLIEQLDQLDSGFEKLFERMKQELEGNKEHYASKIKLMQEHIKSITDKSVEIQAQEKRNKSLMTAKFTEIKNQIRTVRKGTAVANKYYKSMAKLNVIEPQFMEFKK